MIPQIEALASKSIGLKGIVLYRVLAPAAQRCGATKWPFCYNTPLVKPLLVKM